MATLTNEATIAGKSISIAATLISTFQGAQAAFAETVGGIVVKSAAAAVAVAVGLANVNRIKNTPIPKAAQGMLVGASHAQGGILIEAEGGEAIINKQAMANPNLRAMASAINVAGGGIPFFQSGGIVPNTERNQFQELNNTLGNLDRTVLVVEDLDTVQTRVAITESLTTL